jgi:hypothetical protein
MAQKIVLEFPKFITHVPLSKNKWVKIGYNKIHASAHFTVRNAFVAAMHKYIEEHIPNDLKLETPVKTRLIVHVPLNYGSVQRRKDKKTGKAYISWNPAKQAYRPNWDIGNLALVWLKCLDDMLIKKGIIPEDTVEFLKKTTYEFVETKTLDERKLVYELKTI